MAEYQGELSDIEIIIPTTKQDLEAVKQLFYAYQKDLGVDLCFQGFEEEMATFPQKYDLLLLAKQKDQPVGSVAYWTLEPKIVEMKRLYVDPKARGYKVGRLLSERLMTEAKKAGNKTMKLDTLARLGPAVTLYESLGFTRVEAYNFNPEDDIIYMEKSL